MPSRDQMFSAAENIAMNMLGPVTKEEIAAFIRQNMTISADGTIHLLAPDMTGGPPEPIVFKVADNGAVSRAPDPSSGGRSSGARYEMNSSGDLVFFDDSGNVVNTITGFGKPAGGGMSPPPPQAVVDKSGDLVFMDAYGNEVRRIKGFQHAELDPMEKFKIENEQWQKVYEQQERQFQENKALTEKQIRAALAPELARLSLQESEQIADILSNATDYVARSFFSQGEQSPLPQVTKADLINDLRAKIDEAVGPALDILNGGDGAPGFEGADDRPIPPAFVRAKWAEEGWQWNPDKQKIEAIPGFTPKNKPADVPDSMVEKPKPTKSGTTRGGGAATTTGGAGGTGGGGTAKPGATTKSTGGKTETTKAGPVITTETAMPQAGFRPEPVPQGVGSGTQPSGVATLEFPELTPAETTGSRQIPGFTPAQFEANEARNRVTGDPVGMGEIPYGTPEYPISVSDRRLSDIAAREGGSIFADAPYSRDRNAVRARRGEMGLPGGGTPGLPFPEPGSETMNTVTDPIEQLKGFGIFVPDAVKEAISGYRTPRQQREAARAAEEAARQQLRDNWAEAGRTGFTRTDRELVPTRTRDGSSYLPGVNDPPTINRWGEHQPAFWDVPGAPQPPPQYAPPPAAQPGQTLPPAVQPPAPPIPPPMRDMPRTSPGAGSARISPEMVADLQAGRYRSGGQSPYRNTDPNAQRPDLGFQIPSVGGGRSTGQLGAWGEHQPPFWADNRLGQPQQPSAGLPPAVQPSGGGVQPPTYGPWGEHQPPFWADNNLGAAPQASAPLPPAGLPPAPGFVAPDMQQNARYQSGGRSPYRDSNAGRRDYVIRNSAQTNKLKNESKEAARARTRRRKRTGFRDELIDGV